MSIKICKLCGDEFESKTPAKYCSKKHKKTCEFCNKQFTQSTESNIKFCKKRFCSLNCRQTYIARNENFKSKAKSSRIKTFKEKYGVENCSQIDGITQKKKNTNLKNSGYEWNSQSPKIRKKIVQTNLEKYGVENPMQSSKIRDKAKQTNLEKYGVENYRQSEIFQRKIKQNRKDIVKKPKKDIFYEKRQQIKNIHKKCLNCNSEMDIKRKETVVYFKKKKFCSQQCHNFFQTKNKRPSTQPKIKRFGGNRDLMQQWLELDKWAISFCEKNGRKPTYGDAVQYFCVTRTGVNRKVIIMNIKNLFNIFQSYWEIQIVEFLDSCDVEYNRMDRSIIKPQELDFYIPNHNLAIEVNDVRSHNSSNNPYGREYKPKDYHQNKTKTCWEKGIRLIHIWQWDIESGDYKWIIQYFLDNPSLQPTFGEPQLTVVDGLDCWDDGAQWKKSIS